MKIINIRNSIKNNLYHIKPWSKIDEVKMDNEIIISVNINEVLKKKYSIVNQSVDLKYITRKFIAYAPIYSTMYDLEENDLLDLIKNDYKIINLNNDILIGDIITIINNLIQNNSIK